MKIDLIIAIVLLCIWLIGVSFLIISMIIYPYYKCKNYEEKYPEYFKYLKEIETLEREYDKINLNEILPIKKLINDFEENKIYYSQPKLQKKLRQIEEYKDELEKYESNCNKLKAKINLCTEEMSKISSRDIKFKTFENYMVTNELN